MRFRNQKIILLIGIGCLLVGSSVLAKNFTIYNATNVNLPYFSVNGTTGNVGIGLTSPTTPLQLLNNSWISAQNSLGTGTINMFKVNASNQIEVGAPLNIGSFEFSPDSGLVTFVDMPVTSAPAAGTSESYVFKVDGDNIMTIYSESNGLGGIQNKRIGIGTITPKGALDILGGLSMGTYAGVNAPPANGIIVSGNVGIGTTAPNDKLSIGSSGLAAPLGSPDTGHNYTSTYLTSDDYALTNYGLVKSLIGSATSSMGTLWGGATGANIWNLNSGNVGVGITNPLYKLDINGALSTVTSSPILRLHRDYNAGFYYNQNAIFSLAGNSSVWQASTLNIAVSSADTTMRDVMTLDGGSGNVGIGTTNPTAIFQTNVVSNNGVGLKITGMSADSSSDATEGVVIALTHNTAGNRQFFIGDSLSGVGVRVSGATLGGYNKSTSLAQTLNLSPNGNFTTVGYGQFLSLFSINNYNNTVTNPILNIHGAVGQTGNYIQVEEHLATVGSKFVLTSGGKVGIGATAPNDKLSIGSGGLAAPAGSADTGHNYTSSYLSTDDYALVNYGLIKTLIASATSSSALFGGTIGGDIWNLNANNVGIGTTTPLFKFDVNGTFRASSANISSLGAGVVMTDASGNLYATSTLPSGYATGVGVFVGASATSTTGTNNGNPGYDVAYTYCETDYANSHVCTPDEMLNSVRHGAIYPTVNVWIFSGPPGYTASANDCNGRRGAAASDLGAYWEGLTGSFPKGRGLLMACNQSLKIACCK